MCLVKKYNNVFDSKITFFFFIKSATPKQLLLNTQSILKIRIMTGKENFYFDILYFSFSRERHDSKSEFVGTNFFLTFRNYHGKKF